MAKFAVIEGTDVVNIIEAENLSIAETITGKTCIEFTSEPAGVGATYIDGKFIPEKPIGWNPLWTLDENNVWQQPE